MEGLITIVVDTAGREDLAGLTDKLARTAGESAQILSISSAIASAREFKVSGVDVGTGKPFSETVLADSAEAAEEEAAGDGRVVARVESPPETPFANAIQTSKPTEDEEGGDNVTSTDAEPAPE